MTLQSYQEKAERLFHSLALPSFQYGLGISVRPKVNMDDILSTLQQQPLDEARITADVRVKICKLSQCTPEFIAAHVDALVPAQESKLLALHYASLIDATVITIPLGIVLEKPIYINAATKSSAAVDHFIIVAEKLSKATIIHIENSDSSARFKSQVVQVYAAAQATVTFCSLQNLQQQTSLFSVKRAEVQQEASMTWIDAQLGSKFSQLQVQSNLVGPAAHTKALTLFCGNAQQFDLDVQAHHTCSHTTSGLYAKGILSKDAQAIYRGKINIEKNASQSVGHQRADTLLMDKSSRCDAIPILDVHNNDVISSHGTTIGQLAEEQLFYALSRGLDEEAARSMIVQGFVQPILREIPDESLQEQITALIAQKLPWTP